MAAALGIETWHLLRPTTAAEMDLWQNVERLYESMRDNAARQLPLVLHEPDPPSTADPATPTLSNPSRTL